MDVALFRGNFVEFADPIKYPDTLLEFWADIGERLTSIDRYGDIYPHAVDLFVAHNIAVAARSASGSIPGLPSGAITSKSVGSVSVSYDTSSAMTPGAGHWNLTTYGAQYARLARLFGAGVVQL